MHSLFRYLVGLAASALVALVPGCATAPQGKAAAVPRGPFLYPPPPAAPRIQHLVTLSKARDLGEPRSGFADFIAGKEQNLPALTQPYGVAIDRNRVYVADTGGPGLVVFDFDARKVRPLQGIGAGRMKRPINITIDADGTRYVTDTGLDQILVYDSEDRYLRSMGGGQKFRPVDVAVIGEKLYVVDIGNHQILVLNKRTGAVLSKFGKPGTASGDLFHPTNIAVGPGGDLFVTETGNFRVQRFTPDGRHVRFYGEAGNQPGTFARPKGIAVDRAGRIYVGDAAFQNVQIFADDGKLLMDFGRPIDGLEGLNLPAAVKIDYDNVRLFEPYADPKFKVEYLVLVVSQFGPNKVDVFGFGRMAGVDYDASSAGKK
jgi:DNA-binding beta-propeller fold protein YncE